MNSSGWGGRRPGSGPKPKRAKFEPVIRDGGTALSPIPPADLPNEHRDFWHRYAGLAIDKRTLTTHTVPAFRLLCELDAEKRAIKTTIDRDGRTFVKVTIDGAGQEHQELKAHPLTAHYGRTAKAVEALMARFGLAPFGKPEGPMPKKQTANPWAKVGTPHLGDEPA
jgi:hypothetical protein